MTFNTLHHVAIIASDYEKSKDFYINKLGFTVLRETPRPEKDDIVLEAGLENCMLEIFGRKNPPANPGAPQPCGVWHLCFHAPDLDKCIAELHEAGIETGPVMVNSINGKRLVFFNDPDGLPLELHE